MVEIGLLGRGRQFAVKQQIADLEIVAVLCELLDRKAAIFENAFIAVDETDLRLAGRRRGEARIVGEAAGLGVEAADIDDLGADAPRKNVEVPAFVADCQCRGLVGHLYAPVPRVGQSSVLLALSRQGPHSGRVWEDSRMIHRILFAATRQVHALSEDRGPLTCGPGRRSGQGSRRDRGWQARRKCPARSPAR